MRAPRTAFGQQARGFNVGGLEGRGFDPRQRAVFVIAMLAHAEGNEQAHQEIGRVFFLFFADHQLQHRVLQEHAAQGLQADGFGGLHGLKQIVEIGGFEAVVFDVLKVERAEVDFDVIERAVDQRRRRGLGRFADAVLLGFGFGPLCVLVLFLWRCHERVLYGLRRLLNLSFRGSPSVDRGLGQLSGLKPGRPWAWHQCLRVLAKRFQPLIELLFASAFMCRTRVLHETKELGLGEFIFFIRGARSYAGLCAVLAPWVTQQGEAALNRAQQKTRTGRGGFFVCFAVV